MSTASINHRSLPNPYAAPADKKSPKSLKSRNPSRSTSLKSIELFDERHVAVASFFGMPLAGALLLAGNATKLGRPKQCGIILVAGLATTVALMGLSAVIGEYIPNGFGVLIGLGYAAAMKKIAKKVFGDELEESARPRAAHLRAVGVGILSIGLLFSIVYFLNAALIG